MPFELQRCLAVYSLLFAWVDISWSIEWLIRFIGWSMTITAMATAFKWYDDDKGDRVDSRQSCLVPSRRLVWTRRKGFLVSITMFIPPSIPPSNTSIPASPYPSPLPTVDPTACELLGPTALLVQGLMLVLVILSLLIKRQYEDNQKKGKKRRSWKVWGMDVGKQMIGQGCIHGMNLLVSGRSFK